MADPDDEDLAELADELSDVLRELRDELRDARRERDEQSDGLGIDLPSPPSPGELLKFTDERLIPAAVAVLEANIRALELLQGAIRLARPDRAGENAAAARAHAESLSRSTLERLDGVLADLQEAAADGTLPPNAQARDVITEARRLREEIDAALAPATDEPGADADGHPDEADSGESSGEPDEERRRDPFGLDDTPEVDVDVEGELRSIKAELGKIEESDGEDDAGSTGEDGEEPDADDDASPDEGSGADRTDDGSETDGEDTADSASGAADGADGG